MMASSIPAIGCPDRRESQPRISDAEAIAPVSERLD
jgi:hypothetical protein